MATSSPARRRSWWDHVTGIAERGRDVLNGVPGRRHNLAELCSQLLVQRGEASGLALATEIVDRLRQLDGSDRDHFLELLARDFGIDAARVQSAVDAWRREPQDPDAQLALFRAVEAPRQELFRRLNVAPGATSELVALRGRLLSLLRDHPQLRPVEDDLHHLLSSWFNRGFLQLQAIDWRSPALLLEKLITYETVHEIKGWDDLRGRLAADRRCFAFFHPALPDEPLVFLEVALVVGLPGQIRPLLDPDREIGDSLRATTAVFYSINNTQRGLRGIWFGNFLIKQVVAELSDELPNIKTFVTLSPLPRLAACLLNTDGNGGFTESRLRAVIGDDMEELVRATGLSEPRAAVDALLASPGARSDSLRRLAQRVVLAYLTQVRVGDRVLDPVAHFHLSNGARLERINLDADRSEKGLEESRGVMVNYLYDPARLELSHERYVGEGVVTTSRELAGELSRIRAIWERGRQG